MDIAANSPDYPRGTNTVIAGINELDKQQLINRGMQVIDGSGLPPQEKETLKIRFRNVLTNWVGEYVAAYRKSSEKELYTDDEWAIFQIAKSDTTNPNKWKPLDKITNAPGLTSEESSRLFAVMRDYILLDAGMLALLRRAVLNTPILSGLKRMLVLGKHPSGRLQYRWFLEAFPEYYKRRELERAGEERNYNKITDDMLREIICKVMDKYGTALKPEKQNSHEQKTTPEFERTFENWTASLAQPRLKTLLEIAYAFSLSPEDFYKMANCVQALEIDPLDADTVIMEWGMARGLSWDAVNAVIAFYKDEYTPAPAVQKASAVREQLHAFIWENAEEEKTTVWNRHAQPADAKTLQFLELCRELGVGSAHDILTERAEIAQRLLKEVCGLLTEENIKKLRARYEDAVKYIRKHYEYICGKVDEIVGIYSRANLEIRTEKDENGEETTCMDNSKNPFPAYRHGNANTDAENIMGFIYDYFLCKYKTKLINSKKSAVQNALLGYLLGEQNVCTISLLTGEQLSTGRIGQIADGTAQSIDRACILKLCYLRALVPYLCGEYELPEALARFQNKANGELAAASCQRLNYTYLTDFCMFASFSEMTGIFQAENENPGVLLPNFVYQILQPRKPNLRNTAE